MVRGVPWNMSEEDEKANGDKLEVMKINPEEAEAAERRNKRE